jgi:hypothetical protein
MKSSLAIISNQVNISTWYYKFMIGQVGGKQKNYIDNTSDFSPKNKSNREGGTQTHLNSSKENVVA